MHFNKFNLYIFIIIFIFLKMDLPHFQNKRLIYIYIYIYIYITLQMSSIFLGKRKEVKFRKSGLEEKKWNSRKSYCLPGQKLFSETFRLFRPYYIVGSFIHDRGLRGGICAIARRTEKRDNVIFSFFFRKTYVS